MQKKDIHDPIRILHLSDIHFCADKEWDAEPVLRALARFIAGEVEQGLVPHLVAITGDLAFSGQAGEYTKALDWLKNQLWPALPESLPRDRLLLVPGNHDVDRTKVDFIAQATQGALLNARDQNLIANILGDAGQRDVLLKRHTAYLEFLGNWLGETQTLPWWQRLVDICGTRLHVAGLDSAWMACGDEDRGRLLLGRCQINQTVLNPEAENADWRITLLHHPFDYFAECDGHECRQTLHQHCDILLRGHLHETEVFRVVPPDPSRACLELAAGCVYEHGRYPNSFQWIELHSDPRKVRVLFRTWIKGAWVIDRNQSGCEQGYTEFDLESKKPVAIATMPSQPAADPRKYLEDIWTETAHIDIRGLVTGRPDAHRFPIEDLYIELQSSGGQLDGEKPISTEGKWVGERGLKRPIDDSELNLNELPEDSSPGSIGPPHRPGGGTRLQSALIHPRLAIIGDPGCGKTTFLRWVAHCLAAELLGRDPGAARSRLGLGKTRFPLLVSIADWIDFIERAKARHNGPLADGAGWLPEYLGARAEDANQGLAATDFRRLFKEGAAMVLLDGLDEAPDHLQRQGTVRLIEQLARAFPDCPVVVTSRPAAYQDKAVLAGFAHTRIDALDNASIRGFLDRWSRALFPEHPVKAKAHAGELAAALASRREIRSMARNTVMLTALAVVHWNEKRLPEQRAELYESILKWLAEAREKRPGRLKAQRCRQLLGELALAMQSAGQGRQVQVTRRWAAERLAPRFDADIDRAETFLAEEEIDSGIIVRRGRQLKFWHLTFQEYLAAQALAGRQDEERERLLLGSDPALYRSEWRETVLLLGGVLCLQGEDKADGLVRAVIDRLGPDLSRAGQARCAGLLGALLRDLEPFGFRPADPRYREVLDAAMAVFDPLQAPAIPVQDRIAAADALALAGDPRLGWASPARWVALAGGSFAMGAQNKDKKAPGYDPEANERESPVHRVRVDGFSIARFTVTVAEFAEFIEDEDRQDSRWWQAGGGDQPVEPDGWEEQQAHPSRPVVKVSWFQAMAFCAWLTDRLSRPQGAKGTILLPKGQAVRLPTEAEWEYAARGGENRRYPWGSEAPDPQRANYDQSNVGHPNPVGIFPGDSTPEGVLELAGNVWEWCLDPFVEQFYSICERQGTVTNPLATGDAGVPRVLRGGAFNGWSGNLRSTYRGGVGPVDWVRGVGFRCVLAPPRQL